MGIYREAVTGLGGTLKTHWRKLMRKVADLDFMTAPHKIPGGEDDDFTWWAEEEHEERISESIDAVHQAWASNSYDGLLCFSQGAALGGLLCVLQHTGKLPFRFNFCILVSGFVSDKHKDKFATLGEERIQIPSLHITGEKDSIIDGSRTEELSSQFLDGQVCRHPGGHYLPYTGDTKDAVLGFLEARVKELVAKEEDEGEKGA